MWKRGMGCTSIYSAIHFIPLRGLDFSGETKVIRLHVIPQIQQKSSPNSQAKPQPSCRLMLIHKICCWTSFQLADKPLKTSEVAPPSQWSQLLLSNRVFIDGYNVEGGQRLSLGLPWRGSFHTWCTSCHLFLLYFFNPPSSPSLLSYSAAASSRNIFRQRNTTMHSNTLSLLISLSQMQMCCTFLTHFAWKNVSWQVWATQRRKKVSEKVWLTHHNVLPDAKAVKVESFSPLEQRRCENSACWCMIHNMSKISKTPKHKHYPEACWKADLFIHVLIQWFVNRTLL